MHSKLKETVQGKRFFSSFFFPLVFFFLLSKLLLFLSSCWCILLMFLYCICNVWNWKPHFCFLGEELRGWLLLLSIFFFFYVSFQCFWIGVSYLSYCLKFNKKTKKWHFVEGKENRISDGKLQVVLSTFLASNGWKNNGNINL